MADTTVKVLDPVHATAERLREVLSKACHEIAIAGAIRRRHRGATCIDMVAIPKIEQIGGGPDYHMLWAALDYFCDQPEHGGVLKRGDVLRSFLWRLPSGNMIPVNVYSATAENWGLSLANHTGPGDFWAHLVSRLYAEGYAPRDGRLFRLSDGVCMPTPTEQDLFVAYARIPYREAWQRDSGTPARGGW
jgi:hypothetical protein